jgi:hypothetical protein
MSIGRPDAHPPSPDSHETMSDHGGPGEAPDCNPRQPLQRAGAPASPTPGRCPGRTRARRRGLCPDGTQPSASRAPVRLACGLRNLLNQRRCTRTAYSRGHRAGHSVRPGKNTEGNRTETDPGQTSTARQVGPNVDTEREITVALESPAFILTGRLISSHLKSREPSVVLALGHGPGPERVRSYRPLAAGLGPTGTYPSGVKCPDVSV